MPADYTHSYSDGNVGKKKLKLDRVINGLVKEIGERVEDKIPVNLQKIVPAVISWKQGKYDEDMLKEFGKILANILDNLPESEEKLSKAIRISV